MDRSTGKAKGKKKIKDQILKIRWNMEEITKKDIVQKGNLPSGKTYKHISDIHHKWLV